MKDGKLTGKQQAFTDFYILYVLTGEQPIYKAAEAAGYKGNANQLAVQADKNLKIAKISKYINKARDKTSEFNEVTLSEVVGYARKLIDYGAQETLVTDSDDNPKLDTNGKPITRLESESAIKNGMEQLCKITGLYAPEKKEHTHILTHEDWQNRLKQLDSGEITEAQLITDGEKSNG